MSNRLRERQAELEPSRVQYAIEQLTGLGYEVERLTGLGTRLFDEHELLSILENVTSEVLELAQTTTKGLTANPQCDIDDGASKSLIVYNTSGREVLSVWFERIYDRENKPQQTKF